jgi:hypothetical protein
MGVKREGKAPQGGVRNEFAWTSCKIPRPMAGVVQGAMFFVGPRCRNHPMTFIPPLVLYLVEPNEPAARRNHSSVCPVPQVSGCGAHTTASLAPNHAFTPANRRRRSITM